MTDVKLCECGCGQAAPIAKFSDVTKGLIGGQPMRFIRGHNRRGVKPNLEPVESKMKRLTEKTDGCWLWKGGRNRYGYGSLTYDNTRWLAHRLAWVLTNGIAIEKGVVVRHKCDNPTCVNPAHLELGSRLDNLQDMVSRKRQNFFGRRKQRQIGERNPAAKLTAAQVVEIRSRRKQGEPLLTLATEFGISKSYVGNLVAGRKWQHLEENS